ncbi:Scr1 family TA system antitoxin-like transcriptional regulator [Lentzea sp. NPDC005914]|uniref:Scr1 family TA system antitoxin-like transcriptional regulator n=1 Tax=Lentzea sp. NPDC005914 TaxID=3154572 RepID=UPI0033C6A53E
MSARPRCCSCSPSAASRLSRFATCSHCSARRETGYLKIPEDGLPDQMRSLIDQERLANTITVWSMSAIPGRLQTADHMRALVEATARKKTIDYEEVIAARIARHELFHVDAEHSKELINSMLI